MEFFKNFKINNKPSDKEFDALMDKIDFPIDDAYLDFIKDHNGANGYLNNGTYVLLWQIADLIQINRFDEDLPEWNDYFFIGSDGSNLRYGFYKIDGSIISIDPYQLGEVDPEQFGTKFNVFLDVLSKKPPL